MAKALWESLRIRTCLNCGCWFGVKKFLCTSCHQHLLQNFLGSTTLIRGRINCTSLFRWRPDQSDLLSSLAHLMKTEGPKGWELWAQEFAFHFPKKRLMSLQQRNGIILVSSESLTGRRHSQRWGQALAKVLKIEHRCLLRPVKSSRLQKNAGISRRRLRAFECLEEISSLRKKKIIFVDDVVTTGYTALAVYKALGRPPLFEVWSLLYREEKTS